MKGQKYFWETEYFFNLLLDVSNRSNTLEQLELEQIIGMFRNQEEEVKKKSKKVFFNEILAFCKERVRCLAGNGCSGRVPSYPTFAKRPYFNFMYSRVRNTK